MKNHKWTDYAVDEMLRIMHDDQNADGHGKQTVLSICGGPGHMNQAMLIVVRWRFAAICDSSLPTRPNFKASLAADEGVSMVTNLRTLWILERVKNSLKWKVMMERRMMISPRKYLIPASSRCRQYFIKILGDAACLKSLSEMKDRPINLVSRNWKQLMNLIG